MKLPLLWTLLVASLATAMGQQTTVTHSGSARASCLANSGSISNSSVTCTGLSGEDAKILAEMLNNKVSGDIHLVMQQMQQLLQQQQQIAATLSGQSLGNLKERASAFSKAISDWIEWIHRIDPSLRVASNAPDPEAKQEMHEQWMISALNEFDFRYWKNVVKLRDEFASHNYRDEFLDDIIAGVERDRKSNEIWQQTKRTNPDNPDLQKVIIANAPNMAEIEEIAEDFSKLASELH